MLESWIIGVGFFIDKMSIMPVKVEKSQSFQDVIYLYRHPCASAYNKGARPTRDDEDADTSSISIGTTDT